ncbi:fatty acid desaturase family protein [Parvularcula sp. ZS-1/3]|uniref:Fatty acid desaturase family protein n=1 Tax=Parvularcula mediterranea TaxID=2732508 RepID=A0A7Y3RJT9_9PROT|nr:fatty acid desaturase family protein [Parvularcula mediterranea]NNU15404.1 fatty acid desaturase family protein [Parvularcula mediterranea]
MSSYAFKPRSVFSQEEWARLTAPVTWQGPLMVFHAWAVIGLCMAAVTLTGHNPVVLVVAVMVIGNRQLGLAILMHEAAHGLLHRNKKLNDVMGQWLASAPVGTDLDFYRPYHLTHHRFVQTEQDPDLPLAAPFPTTKASMRRKIFRDLTGQTFLKQRAFAIRALFKPELAQVPGAETIAARSAVVRFFAVNLAMFGVLALSGHALVYLTCWLLPLATWNPLATRIRNIAEHACVESDHANPLSQARTTKANFIERVLFAPYWVHYHAEHHAMMYVPCYRLPEAHRLLQEKGLLDGTEVAPGYVSVVRKVTRAA